MIQNCFYSSINCIKFLINVQIYLYSKITSCVMRSNRLLFSVSSITELGEIALRNLRKVESISKLIPHVMKVVFHTIYRLREDDLDKSKHRLL